MEAYSVALWIIGLALEATLILRAKQRGFLWRFPLFYSYMAYVFAGSALTFLISWVRPHHYATCFWFYFLALLLAEFAVIMEISDHIFEPFPAIRRLGRFITIVVSATLLLLYVLPSLLQPRSSSVALLDFALRASLTKGLIIAALLAAAFYYRLSLSKNVAGLMLGFALYLSVYVASLAAAGTFGKALYANVLRFMNPLAYALCLVVWTITMWQFEPVLLTSPKPGEPAEETSEALSYRLERFNTALTKLLRK